MGDDFEDEDEEAGEEEPPPAAAAAAQPPAASPAQVQAAAEARLPPEPPGSEGVRIGEGRGSGCWEARSRADSQVCVPFAIAGGGAACTCICSRPSAAKPARAALRLPDGRRVQRRFPADATLAAVYDLCLAQSEEAADGRAFTLAQAGPGA